MLGTLHPLGPCFCCWFACKQVNVHPLFLARSGPGSCWHSFESESKCIDHCKCWFFLWQFYVFLFGNQNKVQVFLSNNFKVFSLWMASKRQVSLIIIGETRSPSLFFPKGESVILNFVKTCNLISFFSHSFEKWDCWANCFAWSWWWHFPLMARNKQQIMEQVNLCKCSSAAAKQMVHLDRAQVDKLAFVRFPLAMINHEMRYLHGLGYGLTWLIIMYNCNCAGQTIRLFVVVVVLCVCVCASTWLLSQQHWSLGRQSA